MHCNAKRVRTFGRSDRLSGHLNCLEMAHSSWKRAQSPQDGSVMCVRLPVFFLLNNCTLFAYSYSCSLSIVFRFEPRRYSLLRYLFFQTVYLFIYNYLYSDSNFETKVKHSNVILQEKQFGTISSGNITNANHWFI